MTVPPPFLRPGWGSEAAAGLPAPQDQISRLSSRTNTNTGCAWLACRLFPARPRKIRGSCYPNSTAPAKQWEALSLAVNPGRVRVSQPGGVCPGWEALRENNAPSGVGFRPVPQLRPLGPLGLGEEACGSGGAGPQAVRTGRHTGRELGKTLPGSAAHPSFSCLSVPTPGRTWPEGHTRLCADLGGLFPRLQL